MRLPTTSRSRSRRIVSTSGSSGIGAGPRVLADGWRFREQLLPRVPRRRLLGLLLGPTLATALRPAIHENRREEPLGVVRPLVSDLVAGKLLEEPRRELLEPGLVVL